MSNIWMDVKLRLPDKDGFYNCLTQYTTDVCVREFSVSMKCFDNYDGYKVTHWEKQRTTTITDSNNLDESWIN